MKTHQMLTILVTGCLFVSVFLPETSIVKGEYEIRVYGYVIDTEKNPISGADMTLYTSNDEKVSPEGLQTDINGYYDFTVSVDDPECYLQARHQFYYPDTEDIDTSLGEVTKILKLIPEYDTSMVEGDYHEISLQIGHKHFDYSEKAPWIQSGQFMLNDDDYSRYPYNSYSFQDERALSTIEFRPIEYFKGISGDRSLDFALDIHSLANIGNDPSTHGSDGHMQLLKLSDLPNEYYYQLTPPHIKKIEITMDLIGEHEPGDSIEANDFFYSVQRRDYTNVGFNQYSPLGCNLAPVPDFDETLFPQTAWTETNNYGNTVEYSNDELHLINTNDEYLDIHYPASDYIVFNEPQRYITAFYEGFRLSSSDEGNDVGLKLQLKLEDGSNIEYMPSELRMGRLDNMWAEHHVILDAYEEFGSFIEELRIYLVDNEDCTAVIDNVYVGPTFWDLQNDPTNPDKLEGEVEWMDLYLQYVNDPTRRIWKGIYDIASFTGDITTMASWIPLNPYSEWVEKINLLSHTYCLLYEADYKEPEQWKAFHDDDFTISHNFPIDGSYRPFETNTYLRGHMNLHKDSLGDRFLQISVNTIYGYTDSQYDDLFWNNEIITVKLVDDVFDIPSDWNADLEPEEIDQFKQPPILHLPLDDPIGSTTAHDTSRNHFDATIEGATQPEHLGVIGNAYSFNGIDSYLSIDDHDGFSFGDGSHDKKFSISAWINPGEKEGVQHVVSKYASEKEWLVWLFEDNNNDGFQGYYRLYLSLFDQWYDYGISAYSTAMIPANIWTHIAITYDGRGGSNAHEGITLYINGQDFTEYRAGNQNYLAMHNTNNPIIIGGHAAENKYYYQGLLDDLRIYQRALPSEEIKSLYEPLFSDQLDLHLKFDEGSGTEVYDDTGNHNLVGADFPSWAFGQFGYALDFELDENNYLQMGGGLQPAKGRTYSMWIKPEAWKEDQLFYGLLSESNSVMAFTLSSGGGIYLSVRDTNEVWHDSCAFGIIATGQWQHVVGVIQDNGRIDLYLNGIEIDYCLHGTISDTIQTGGAQYIGADTIHGGKFDGVMDDVRVYDCALSAYQIANMYEYYSWRAATTFTESFEIGVPLANGWTNLFDLGKFVQSTMHDVEGTYAGKHELTGEPDPNADCRIDRWTRAGTHTECTVTGYVYVEESDSTISWAEIRPIHTDEINYLALIFYQDKIILRSRIDDVITDTVTSLGTDNFWRNKQWQFSVAVKDNTIYGWVKTGDTVYFLNSHNWSGTSLTGYVVLKSRINYGIYWYDALTLVKYI